MPFQGLIFDFNGVLWWDGHLQELTWNSMAIELRGKRLMREEITTHIHGRTNRDILGYLTGRPVEGTELARLVERKESHYRRECLKLGEAFRLSPGA